MSKIKGLTLVELLIVIAVSGILLGVAVPGFQQLISDTRASSAANRLVGSLNFARAESVRLGVPVTVCASRDGRQCSGEEADWSRGWIVYHHETAQGARRLQHEEQILRVSDTAAPGFRANRQRFTLRTDGRRSTNGTLLNCPDGAARARLAVVVNVMGRVRSTRETGEMPSPDC